MPVFDDSNPDLLQTSRKMTVISTMVSALRMLLSSLHSKTY